MQYRTLTFQAYVKLMRQSKERSEAPIHLIQQISIENNTIRKVSRNARIRTECYNIKCSRQVHNHQLDLITSLDLYTSNSIRQKSTTYFISGRSLTVVEKRMNERTPTK